VHPGPPSGAPGRQYGTPRAFFIDKTANARKTLVRTSLRIMDQQFPERYR
jgi:hypothetical protein